MSWLLRAFEWGYMPALRTALRWPLLVLAVAIASLAGSVHLIREQGSEFLPELNEGALYVTFTLPSNVSLSEGRRLAPTLLRMLDQFPEVQSTMSQLGRPEDGTDPKLSNNLELFIKLRPAAEWPKDTPDLGTLTRNADIKADPGALRSLDRSSVPTGRLQVPELDMHTISDQLVPVQQENYYRHTVDRSVDQITREAYLREQVEVVLGHQQADLAHGLAVGGLRKVPAHHVAHAQHHVGEELGHRRPRALEHPLGLGVQLAQPDGNVRVARIHPPHELGVADRGGDRVRVRVAMTGDVDAGQGGDDRSV